MIEEYIQKAYDLLKIYRKINPAILMRKFQINYDMARKICNKVSLRMHLEARELAKDVEKF